MRIFLNLNGTLRASGAGELRKMVVLIGIEFRLKTTLFFYFLRNCLATFWGINRA